MKIQIYDLALFLRVQNLVWLGSSSSGSPMRLVSGVIHACSHLKAWLGLRIHFGGGATHRAGKSVLAVCGRPQRPSMGASPQATCVTSWRGS